MFEKFNDIHKLLEQQLWRGIEDGSIRELLVKETAQILMSLVVGANRTVSSRRTRRPICTVRPSLSPPEP